MSTLRRLFRLALAVALILAAFGAFRSYRIRASERAAARFLPIEKKPISVPANTAIRAVVRNHIAHTASAGDPVTAFVVTPVVSGNTTVIPFGAQLNGSFEKVSFDHSMATTTMLFTQVVFDNRTIPIQTRKVIVISPVENDFAIMSDAIRALMGTGLGAAIGAGTGDSRLLDRGVMDGVNSSVPDDFTIPASVVLTDDLDE